ncbi:hypothetical protein PR048_002879 [Dryococelus australis]|uniref:Uncharacterized protein n=1 Tax=Dryococelus australis TaxID=614101 RepID=A0ABQ9IM07_9NEOP|nr:hypothetical protein PR048_002879 [Dryococelus australis]
MSSVLVSGFPLTIVPLDAGYIGHAYLYSTTLIIDWPWANEVVHCQRTNQSVTTDVTRGQCWVHAQKANNLWIKQSLLPKANLRNWAATRRDAVRQSAPYDLLRQQVAQPIGELRSVERFVTGSSLNIGAQASAVVRRFSGCIRESTTGLKLTEACRICWDTRSTRFCSNGRNPDSAGNYLILLQQLNPSSPVLFRTFFVFQRVYSNTISTQQHYCCLLEATFSYLLGHLGFGNIGTAPTRPAPPMSTHRTDELNRKIVRAALTDRTATARAARVPGGHYGRKFKDVFTSKQQSDMAGWTARMLVRSALDNLWGDALGWSVDPVRRGPHPLWPRSLCQPVPDRILSTHPCVTVASLPLQAPSFLVFPLLVPSGPRSLLASHGRETGSIPDRATPGFSASENRAGRCRWSAGFLGDLPFPPALASQRCLHSHFVSISSVLKTSLLRAPPKSLNLALVPSVELVSGYGHNRNAHNTLWVVCGGPNAKRNIFPVIKKSAIAATRNGKLLRAMGEFGDYKSALRRLVPIKLSLSYCRPTIGCSSHWATAAPLSGSLTTGLLRPHYRVL